MKSVIKSNPTQHRLNRLLALVLITVFVITSIPLEIFAKGTGGGTGTDYNPNPGSGVGVPNTTTDNIIAYTVSLVDVQYENGVIKRENVMGSMVIKGKPDRAYHKVDDTWIYGVGDPKTLAYRPATKIDFQTNYNKIKLVHASKMKMPIGDTNLLYKLNIGKNNTEEAVKYYTDGKGNDAIFDNIPKNLNDIIYYLHQNMVFEGSYDIGTVLNGVKNGTIAMHVEPMMQEFKPVRITYTAAGYAEYKEDTHKGDSNRPKGGKARLKNYFSQTPIIGNALTSVAHIKSHQSGTSTTSLSNKVEGYDTFTKGVDTKDVNFLKKKAGIYIIKLIPKDNSTKHPTEINIPPTDFHMTTLKPVPNEDGLLIDLEKGEITLDVRGGYNGDTRGYGEGGNTNVDEDGNNSNLAGADNSSITYKGHPWKETDGSLMENTIPILFAKTASNKDSLTKISCPIHGAYAVPIEDDRLESEFGIPGLARVFNYSVFPNDRLEQEWVENPRGIVADDGCRIFPELQEYLHEKTIEAIENNSSMSQHLNSKVREALKINGLKLDWNERNITKEFLEKDDRIKFQVYLQTDYQKLQGKGEGIVSYNEHITETMDKNNVNSLPGNKSLKLKVQNNDNGTLTLKWDPNDPKIKEALEYSKSIFVTASINWIEPEDRQTHAYTDDKWLRTESINSNNIQGGNGWINNSLQFELRIPRPNLTAIEVTPRYDEEREMICIEGVGFIDKLLPGQKTISSDHTIRLYDDKFTLISFSKTSIDCTYLFNTSFVSTYSLFK